MSLYLSLCYLSLYISLSLCLYVCVIFLSLYLCLFLFERTIKAFYVPLKLQIESSSPVLRFLDWPDPSQYRSYELIYGCITACGYCYVTSAAVNVALNAWIYLRPLSSWYLFSIFHLSYKPMEKIQCRYSSKLWSILTISFKYSQDYDTKSKQPPNLTLLITSGEWLEMQLTFAKPISKGHNAICQEVPISWYVFCWVLCSGQ